MGGGARHQRVRQASAQVRVAAEPVRFVVVIANLLLLLLLLLSLS